MATLPFQAFGKDAVRQFIEVKCMKEGQNTEELLYDVFEEINGGLHQTNVWHQKDLMLVYLMRIR